MSAAMDSEWARTAFDNPTALLPQKRAVAPPRPAQAAPRPPEAPRKSDRRYPLHSIDEIENFPPAKYILKNVLTRNSISAAYGPSGSGKTFLAYAMAFAISDDEDFFEYRVAPCDVLVISLEGQSGLAQRVQAQRKRGSNGSRIKFTTAPLSLNFADDIDALIATAHDHEIHDGLIILDTLNAAMVGLDENSSTDMGRAVAALKRLRDETGCAVMVIHHSGKDSSKGLRGHSLLHAALDSVIEVSREGDRRSWKLTKSKDGADGEEHPFRLEVVELGTDDDGDIITSCAVAPDEDAKPGTRSRLPKGGNQRIIWNALGELLRASTHFGKGGAPALRPCVDIAFAVAELAPRLAVDSSRQTERTRQAITGLAASGVIELRSGWIWIP
ncbi:MAG: AAA family ATPase [Rugosibacter sp.]|nr:AAA family ATPase [Rugosibacter sp.]